MSSLHEAETKILRSRQGCHRELSQKPFSEQHFLEVKLYEPPSPLSINNPWRTNNWLWVFSLPAYEYNLCRSRLKSIAQAQNSLRRSQQTPSPRSSSCEESRDGITMSARRSAGRSLVGLGRGKILSFRKPYSMSIHTRASIVTLRTCSPQQSPISTSRSTTPKRVHPRSHAGTLYPHRAFSATSAVAHGHLDPPKPGEE